MSPPMSVDHKAITTAQAALNFDDDALFPSPHSPPRKRPKSRLDPAHIEPHDVDAITTQIGTLFEDMDGSDDESVDNTGHFDHIRSKLDPKAMDQDKEASSSEEEEEDSPPPSPVYEQTETEERAPDTWIRGQFKEHCACANENFLSFTKHEVRTIKLLHLLKAKNAPMNAYEPVC